MAKLGQPEADYTMIETDEVILSVPLESIIVKESRYRIKMGDIEDLANSIKEVGQQVPAIINMNNVLVAGERRFRACQLLNRSLRCVKRDYSDIDMKIIEIRENIDRKDFEWEEKVKATEDLHLFLMEKYGSKWSGRKTAEKTKLSIGGVNTDLQLAKALRETPDIFEKCKTRDQALKALKKRELDDARAELALRNAKKKYGMKAKNFLILGDARDILPKMPDNQVNVMVTDPPYGIDVFNTMFHSTRDIPSENKDSYEDSEEYFKELMLFCAPHFDRILKPDAGVVCFCAYSNSQWIIDLFKSIGFNMDVIPGIWVKKANTARTNVPERYFNRAYELFVYGTRGNFVLAKAGTCNVIDAGNVASTIRIHPSEKPLELAEELLSRMCLPGHVVFDPFAGSAVVLTAAIKRGCIPLGCERDQKFYMQSLQRIAKALELKDGNMAGDIQ